MANKKYSITGSHFGQMKVLSVSEESNQRYIVECQRCGNIETRLRDNIVRAIKKKCGICRRCGDASKTNLSKHPIYKVWEGMVRRCYSKKHNAYKNYGGRGISVCEEWIKDPASFIEWSYKNKYRPGLELDRRDNDGDYTPQNCRFVTGQVNRCNMRTNRMVTLGGDKVTISQASRMTGIGYTTIRERIVRGWDINRIFAAVKK